MSHHNPPSCKRDYYTHHILKTLHIITYSLYIFYCIYLTFTNVYSTFTIYIFTTTSVYKEIFFQRFAKFPQVFNPHFLMVVLLTSCNISHTHGFTVSSSLRLILISERLNKISFFALLTN